MSDPTDMCYECVNYCEENESRADDGILVSDCAMIKATSKMDPTVEHWSCACDDFVRGMPKSLTDRPGGWPIGICREDAVNIKTGIMNSNDSCAKMAESIALSSSTIAAIRNGTTWYNVPFERKEQ